ncbi:disease resistance protein (TIR-NBS class), putative [Medicago truncatula]|uniref:cysteine dioxygenase n=1 Tax=Medicago truncatula TaxID=3880 RepID=A0A072UXY3_MEDTR|nr:disease resistance protein (TIR-NBS class), putative [Medicago truncatula]
MTEYGAKRRCKSHCKLYNLLPDILVSIALHTLIRALFLFGEILSNSRPQVGAYKSYVWINLVTNEATVRPAQSPTAILYPTSGRNINYLQAITPCAVFDILSPHHSLQRMEELTPLPAITKKRTSSSNEIDKRRNYYDVFVSFKGKDTRYNFIDHLFASFRRKGIIAFKDDAMLKKGESIAP